MSTLSTKPIYNLTFLPLLSLRFVDSVRKHFELPSARENGKRDVKAAGTRLRCRFVDAYIISTCEQINSPMNTKNMKQQQQSKYEIYKYNTFGSTGKNNKLSYEDL